MTHQDIGMNLDDGKLLHKCIALNGDYRIETKNEQSN